MKNVKCEWCGCIFETTDKKQILCRDCQSFTANCDNCGEIFARYDLTKHEESGQKLCIKCLIATNACE